MPHVRIDSVADERVAAYRDLPNAKLASGLFIAEGRLLVERLVASSFRTHSILCDERRASLLPKPLPDVPVFVTSAEAIEEIVGFEFHRGVLACGHRSVSPALSDACSALRSVATVLACVDVQDPTNLGGILRSCAAFGVDAVLLSKGCADPLARRVLRVSMGGAFNMPIVECEDVARDLATLRSDFGFDLVATVVDTGDPLETSVRAPRTALLIGSEAQGLPHVLVEQADRQVTIPMSLNTDSLNASVAAGVLLYHFTRVAKV